MDTSTLTFIVLGLAVVGFVTNRLPMVVVALFVPVALCATGVLTLGEAFAGFSDPIVVFIATLFVLSEALDSTGVTAWLGRQLEKRAGVARARLLVATGLVAAVLSAVISINGAVAALLPIVVLAAARADIAPSRLLIPLAFAASAGSLLTLTGTPVNIIVSEAAAAAGGREFGFFEFALAGVPLVILTLTASVLLGDRLLPERTPQRMDEPIPDPSANVRSWRETYHLSLDTASVFQAETGVAEVVIAPRSTLIGRVVSPGMTTRDENLIVLAIRRGDGTSASGPADAAGGVSLQAGDAVLVQGPWEALQRYVSSPDVIPVGSPRSLQRTVPMGRGAKRTLTILGAAVVLLATGVLPPAIVGLLAAGALVVSGVVTVPQSFRAISWSTVVLIAGMIPLSQAIVSSGAADVIAGGVLAVAGTASPHLALLVICLLTVVLGQFISNVATVLVMVPIASSFAQTLGVSPQPFMMALTVVGAASFLTPIATPVNLMVMQPGGYRFGDYWRFGVPLTAAFVAVAVLYVPLIWGF
jgi:di/tricarboxylate transporter